jgi:hypothetical protein
VNRLDQRRDPRRHHEQVFSLYVSGVPIANNRIAKRFSGAGRGLRGGELVDAGGSETTNFRFALTLSGTYVLI